MSLPACGFGLSNTLFHGHTGASSRSVQTFSRSAAVCPTHTHRESTERATIGRTHAMRANNKVSPRGRRDDMPPPMAVRRWKKSRRIYVRPRTGPRSAHLWWPAVAKLQAAGVPIAQAAAPRDRQTDGSQYRLIFLVFLFVIFYTCG